MAKASKKSDKDGRKKPEPRFQDPVEQRVFELALADCPLEEIADAMDMDRNDVKQKYRKALKAGKAEKKVFLRQTNFKHAKHDPGTAWKLSKNILGYTDNPAEIKKPEASESVKQLAQKLVNMMMDKEKK